MRYGKMLKKTGKFPLYRWVKNPVRSYFLIIRDHVVVVPDIDLAEVWIVTSGDKEFLGKE
jgi:hypothetical protein